MPLESCGVSCGGTDRHSLCIIGYGNRERRDDGLGSYVVGSLAKRLRPREQIKLLVLRQLDVDVVEDLRHTELVLFVDASIEPLDGGWQWTELKPDIRDIHFTSHHVGPSTLLGLTLLLYGRCPDAWQLAIQGECFTFGEALSSKARKRAETLIAELAQWIANGQRCWQLEGWDIPGAAYVGLRRPGRNQKPGRMLMGGGVDVLVIDDDRDLVNTIRIILESENYRVRTAYNGREGYQRIEDKVPDLIILDVMMATDTEGFDLACKLKNNPHYRDIPILMVTAFPQKMAEEGPDRFQHILGESWPVSLFIEKPVDPEELLRGIQDLLGEKGG